MLTWPHLLYNSNYLIKLCWWFQGQKLLRQDLYLKEITLFRCIKRLLRKCFFRNLSTLVHLFYRFWILITLSSEEQIFTYICFYYRWLVFSLSYFVLNKFIINTGNCFFPSYIQSAFLLVAVFFNVLVRQTEIWQIWEWDSGNSRSITPPTPASLKSTPPSNI